VSAEKGTELGFEAGVGCIEHLPAWHDDNVDGAGWFVVAKQFANQPLRPISFHGRPHFSGGCNAKPRGSRIPVAAEHRHQPAGALKAGLVDELKICSFADVFGRQKPRQVYFSSETVSRFRPLARRRLSTCRPS